MKSCGQCLGCRLDVAPARERGLKYSALNLSLLDVRRSRKGAWIEIASRHAMQAQIAGRSRKGAWIEMSTSAKAQQKHAGRSRKGAWIEICVTLLCQLRLLSLPQGSVD